MSSKFSKLGYLEINHRESPGLDESLAHRAGLGGLPVGKGQVLQADTYTCSHCCAVVVMNPARRRDRAYCAKCDRWICDLCGAALAQSGVCGNLERLFDFLQEQYAKREKRGPPAIGLPDLSPLYNTARVYVPGTDINNGE